MARGRKRKGRGRKGRRRNPNGVSYGSAALLGAGLGAVGLAISAAMRASTPQEVVTPLPSEGVVSSVLGYVKQESPGMAITKAVMRGAVLGAAVGVAAAVVANEAGVGAMGRMMNPVSPAAGIALGTAMATATVAGDHLLGKAINAA